MLEEVQLISVLSVTGSPFGPSGDVLNTIISLLMYLSFILFMFFGQKIQVRLMLFELDGVVKRLEYMKNDAKLLSLKTLKEIGKSKEDPTPELNVMLEQFLISPEGMDPAGIVWKLDHLLDVREMKFKDDVKKIAPEADESQINNLENLIEASQALNTIYRIVQHYYLLGKKNFKFLHNIPDPDGSPSDNAGSRGTCGRWKSLLTRSANRRWSRRTGGGQAHAR